MSKISQKTMESNTKNQCLAIFDYYLTRRIRGIESDFENGYFKECDKNLIINELKAIQRKTADIQYFINDIKKTKYWSDEEIEEINLLFQ